MSTIDRHVANIYAKAGVHNRAEATLWAVANGVVSAAGAKQAASRRYTPERG